ncbi:hypothetical protein Y032_0189g1194 [Ancylostoma ceylanicum]|uniref:Uncharacterized protein n=1 Tax=Ancylostoma ceylanicum TaxID=53326 RepID=A0A016SRA6_9BILA|nr:hypothetical protein Y032_0189g1194 [Ancylostoma ceylanicum]
MVLAKSPKRWPTKDLLTTSCSANNCINCTDYYAEAYILDVLHTTARQHNPPSLVISAFIAVLGARAPFSPEDLYPGIFEFSTPMRPCTPSLHRIRTISALFVNV